ncbi:hypothetical protein ACFLZN_01285 [Nanoarchaeota archaeon]
MPENEDYELLPHKEIEELKKELEQLKEMEVTPTKKLHISLIEVNRNIDKLLNIFEEAIHEVKIEEGGLSLKDKLQPLVTRVKDLENTVSDIAGVVFDLAHKVDEIHDKVVLGEASMATPSEPSPEFPPDLGIPEP